MATDARDAAFRHATEPLRAPPEDWMVTDAEADLAGRRLAALDDETFSAVVARMALVEEGRYLRRLLTETEEERAGVPEAIRAFVERLARRASVQTARAALLSLRGHALGRFLAALGAVPREAARRLLTAAGGPDVVAALAVEEALRALADDNRRAIRSLSSGLAALLRVQPPAVYTIRTAASHLARRINEWSGPACEAFARALERGAVMDHEAPGFDPAAVRDLPPPFAGDDALIARLYDDLRERRPRPAKGSPPE
jgi:hypothetical protein